MIYPDSIEHKIGFDVVREHVERLCSSQPGRDCCSAMTFSTNFNEVRTALEQTAETESALCLTHKLMPKSNAMYTTTITN